MIATIIAVLQLALAGLLAGEEFVVCYGVHPALATLSERSHVETRVALVKRLKVVVPAIMVPTVIVAIVLLLVAWSEPGLVWRVAGAVALVAFVLFSFLGTVPINIKVNDWDVENPPADWQRLVSRWARLDVFRSSAAILSFVLFAVAFAMQVG